MPQRIRLAIVTNNPVAFRVPVFDRVAAHPDIELQVIYCAKREPGRKSDVPPLGHRHVFLRERYRIRPDGYSIHNNRDVGAALRQFKPHAIMNYGFQPTNLYAFTHALIQSVAHVPATDGTLESERSLSRIHRGIRRAVFSASSAFVGASEGSWRLYEQYGVPRRKFFQSHLCIDNDRFHVAETGRDVDFIVCGRLIPEKRPDFALDVAKATAERLGREVSLLMVGSGALEDEMRGLVGKIPGVRLIVHGFATQHELPALYARARIFLFPTVMDTWGVVANEACAAGLPVIVTPHAGVVGELVKDGVNGYVRDFDVTAWATAATTLLQDPALWQRFADRSRQLVSYYTHHAAADGMVHAAILAADSGVPRSLLAIKAGMLVSPPVLLAGLDLAEFL